MKKLNALYGWANTSDQIQSNEIGPVPLKLSIVIPTLNQVDTIEDTLISILGQSYQHFEVIVIDGGSTDGTLHVLDEYKAHIAYLETGSDGGQSQAINRGFCKASGDVFAWINSDDFYMPGALAEVVRIFSQNSEADVVIGGGHIVTKNCTFLRHVPPMPMERSLLLEWENGQWLMQQSCFWRSQIWSACGGVDETLSLLMDYDLWLRFASIGTSSLTDKVLGVMRYYPEAKSVSMKERVDEETAYVYAKNGAYQELRGLVGRLHRSKDALAAELAREQRTLPSRLMRRLQFSADE